MKNNKKILFVVLLLIFAIIIFTGIFYLTHGIINEDMLSIKAALILIIVGLIFDIFCIYLAWFSSGDREGKK